MTLVTTPHFSPSSLAGLFFHASVRVYEKASHDVGRYSSFTWRTLHLDSG
jgi:hypothetical protein